MTSHYRVLPAADCDLDEYAAYLESQAGLDTALRFYDAAASTFSRIAGMPGIGERWTSSNPRLADLRVRRIEGFENSIVFYRPSDEGIDIDRVLHGARDIDRALER